jgi:NTP pyrophosphatase (non-canonical NTP hydrolase)
MTFDEYQQQIKKFAIYPGAGTGNLNALSYTALGLAEEAGEYAGKVSKLIRDNVFETQLATAELGDVLWQLTRAASELNVSLVDIAHQNIAKLEKRVKDGTLQGSGDGR